MSRKRIERKRKENRNVNDVNCPIMSGRMEIEFPCASLNEQNETVSKNNWNIFSMDLRFVVIGSCVNLLLVSCLDEDVKRKKGKK